MIVFEIFDLTRITGDQRVGVDLPRGSLAVLRGPARYLWTHAIALRKTGSNYSLAAAESLSLPVTLAVTPGTTRFVYLDIFGPASLCNDSR